MHNQKAITQLANIRSSRRTMKLTCRNVQHNSISGTRALYKTVGCRNDASASMKLAKRPMDIGQALSYISFTPAYLDQRLIGLI